MEGSLVRDSPEALCCVFEHGLLSYVQWSQHKCGKIAQLGRKCHNYIPTHACIRICTECENGKDKSVPRITNWPHEACRVMTISDHKGRVLLSYPHTNNVLFFFSCSPLSDSFYVLKRALIS